MALTKAAIALTAWRLEQDIPQWKVAQSLEMCSTQLSKYEKGRMFPGVIIALRIERLTGIEVQDWGEEADEPEATGATESGAPADPTIADES